MKQERKHFFSEEKKQKTFIPAPAERCRPTPEALEPRSWKLRRSKSLLVLFFRKEHSSFLGLPQ
jgi:hypothetical protein